MLGHEHKEHNDGVHALLCCSSMISALLGGALMSCKCIGLVVATFKVRIGYLSILTQRAKEIIVCPLYKFIVKFMQVIFDSKQKCYDSEMLKCL